MVFQAPEAKLQMWPLFPRRRSSACPPPSVPFREGIGEKKANQNNSSRHSITLCSTSVQCTTVIVQVDLLKVPHQKVLTWLQKQVNHILCCCSSGRKQLSLAKSEASSSPSAHNPSVSSCSSHSVIHSVVLQSSELEWVSQPQLGMQVPVTQWHYSAPNWGTVTRSERKRRAHVLLSCLNPIRPRKPSEPLKQAYREMKTETP